MVIKMFTTPCSGGSPALAYSYTNRVINSGCKFLFTPQKAYSSGGRAVSESIFTSFIFFLSNQN